MSKLEQPRSSASSTVILEAEKPTGEQPMELFITDEHTEHYLALQSGGDSYRGLWTGILGGMAGCGSLGLTLMLAMQGIFDYIMLVLGNRSTNYTYLKIRRSFTVGSLASSSTAVRLRSLRPMWHAATVPVRGAATYRAPGR